MYTLETQDLHVQLKQHTHLVNLNPCVYAQLIYSLTNAGKKKTMDTTKVKINGKELTDKNYLCIDCLRLHNVWQILYGESELMEYYIKWKLEQDGELVREVDCIEKTLEKIVDTMFMGYRIERQTLNINKLIKMYATLCIDSIDKFHEILCNIATTDKPKTIIVLYSQETEQYCKMDELIQRLHECPWILFLKECDMNTKLQMEDYILFLQKPPVGILFKDVFTLINDTIHIHQLPYLENMESLIGYLIMGCFDKGVIQKMHYINEMQIINAACEKELGLRVMHDCNIYCN